MEQQQVVLYNQVRHLPITFRDVVTVVFRHKRAMSLSFIGVLVGALLIGILWPSYQAETELMLARDRVDPIVTPSQSSPVIMNNTVTPEEVNSEVELLRSEDVLRQVALASGLDQKRSLRDVITGLFGISANHDKKIARAVRKLHDKLEIEAVPTSNIIKVTYTSSDPRLSARVLSALDAAYLQKHKQVHRPSGQFQFFANQTERYRNELADAEARLQAFSKQSRIVNPQLARDIGLQKLSDYKVNLGQLQASIAETQRRIKELEELARSTPSRVTTQLRHSDDAMVLQQLKSTLLTLQLKKVELSTRYKPDYPLVQEVDRQLTDTQTAIAKEEAKPLRDETSDQNPAYTWVDSELVKSRADLQGYQARAATTAKLVQDNLQNILHLDQADITEQDLVRNVKTAEDSYLLYLRKREESRITDALDQNHILNVAVAEKPDTPLLPTESPLLIGILSLVLATAVSSGTVLSLEYMDRSFRTPAEVEGILQVPLLATIPLQLDSGNISATSQGNVLANQ